LAIVVVPRLVNTLMTADGGPPIGHATWSDTSVALPASTTDLTVDLTVRNALTGKSIAIDKHSTSISVGQLLQTLPVALLIWQVPR
jgi:maltooligosyltrehalose synthase